MTGFELAYVSADLRDHPVAFLTAGLFELHDRSCFETTAISLFPDQPGTMLGRLKKAFDHFLVVDDRSNAQIADMMREMEIDIAVDLMGHTQNARTGVFAGRAAPIQVNYLGFGGTMGASYIDYIIADPFLVPDGARKFYTEQVVHLPDSAQANDGRRTISASVPKRAAAGLPERGVVFCAFNSSYKINPPMFDIWCRLLRDVEGSVLWILSGDDTVEQNLRREAWARGVAPERLVFAPRIPHSDHLARCALADIFLDTFPCNGGATTSDVLWAGVPVVACAGETFVSRVSGSLLRAVELPELITYSLVDYEALALKLARDRDLLTRTRARLAENRTRSPLFDTERFTRHLESAYVGMWERFQRGEPPTSFAVAPGGVAS